MKYELKDFSTDVIQASFTKPVLVDFWAEWCGPCRILGPVLEKLADQNNGDWTLVKINSDDYPEISAEYGIRSIPNVKLFYKGEVINEFVGALPEHLIKEWLKKNIPSKFDSMLTQAKTFLSDSKEEEAQKIIQEILRQEPSNHNAKLILTQIILFQNPERAIQIAEEIEETKDNEEFLNAVRTIALLISRDNRQNLQDTPTKKLYIDAVEQLRSKQFASAIEKFIEIIRTDRFYADDIARKACIAIFKYLGEEHEITIKYRRDFSSALYI